MIVRNRLGIAWALGAAAMYGFVPNLARGAFVNGIPPVETTFFRTSLIAVALAIVAIVRGETLHVPRAGLASFVGQSMATLVVSVGYLASVQFIPVGLAVIIFFSFPVVIMLSAPVIEGHSPGLIRILIAIFAFLGLAVAVGPSFDSLDIRGIALAAGASLFCALQFFSGRSISRHMQPAAFGALIHAAIWPATLLIAVLAGGGEIRMFPGGTAEPLAYAFMTAVGLIYVLAYAVHMLSLRFAAASVVAPYYNLEPVVTTLVAALFLGERLALNQYVGGGMVLAALVASSLVGKRKTEPA